MIKSAKCNFLSYNTNDMVAFEKIIDFVNYIPNCLICGKENKILLEVPDNNSSYKTVFIKSIIKDNILHSTNSKFKLKINILTNEYIDNSLITESITRKDNIYVHKTCATCRLDVTARFSNKLAPLDDYHKNYDFKNFFPKIHLESQSVSYMVKNHVSIYLLNSYNNYNSYLFEETPIYTSLSINDKYNYVPSAIDLSKIKDFKSLKRKVKMLLTFK